MRHLGLLMVFSLIVWAFCGAIMGIGRSIWSIETTLWVHLFGAAVGAAAASWLYARLSGHFAPVVVAASFVATALFLDVFLVAMVIEGSFAMFRGPMGVWLPMIAVFVAAWGAGRLARRAI